MSDIANLRNKKVKPSAFHFREARDLNGVRMFLRELTNFYETDVRFRSESIPVHFNYFRLWKQHGLTEEANHQLKVLCGVTSRPGQEGR